MADEVVSALQKELVEALAACRAANERAEFERTAREAANERAELERTAREAVDAALRATTVELNASLQLLQLAAVRNPPVAPVDSSENAVIRSLLSMPSRILSSPSSAIRGIVDGILCAIVERPIAATMLNITLPSKSVATAFHSLLDVAAGDSRALAQEANFYGRVTKHIPVFAETIGGFSGSMDASVLFTCQSLKTRSWSFSRNCLPELHVRGKVTASHAFRPAFNGEVKSVGITWLEQAVYYTAMDMVRIFFPASEDGAACGPRRFFSRPPLGFALVTFPHVGYIVALEWIGVLFVSPVSAPFFVDSSEHAAAIGSLPDVTYEDPMTLDEQLEWHTWSAGLPRLEAVSWAVSRGRFYKLVCADARPPARFRELYDSYKLLEGLESDAKNAPPALEPVALGIRLLFGAHEVLIDMAALDGARNATDDEVTTAGGILNAAAAAVAWLATRGLLYIDLRGPNVLIAGDKVWLVDYDDCCVLDAPVHDIASFRRALIQTDAAARGDWASALTRDALPDVNTALANSFLAIVQ
jgi:hypothetical protein